MSNHLSTAIYTILKPLIGLMVRNGLSFGEFSRIAKHAYIEVIEKELIASGEKATTSSIAVVTGLTRKDVAALRKGKTPKSALGQQQNRAIRVISGWVGDPEFSNKKGKARILDIQGKQGSFESLVNRYSGDIPYQALLKELIRFDAVEIINNDTVKLVRAAYIPSTDENSKYDVLGEDASLLISTIKHNIISGDTEPRYQRKVCYNKIPVEHLDEFKKLANKENQLLLLKLNAWLAQHDMDTQNVIKSNKTTKVGVGVYYFEDPKEGHEVKDD